MPTGQNIPDDYVLFRGSNWSVALTNSHPLKSRIRMAAIALGIAWLPIIIITGIQGTLFSDVQMPFLYDIAMQARLLLALPLLILIRSAIDEKVTDVLRYMCNELMSPEEREHIIATAFRRTKILTDSIFTEIVLLLIVVIVTVSMTETGLYKALKGNTTTWMTDIVNGGKELSLAGIWAVWISNPLIQFLLYRWLWRYIVWTALIFRLSKANLKLLPTHADNSGGLGILMLAQRSFNMLFVVIGIVLSGQLMSQLLQHPDSFITVRNIAVSFIVFSVLLLVFPLVFFLKKLVQIKNKALLDLSKLSADLSDKFEREWANKQPVDQILEQQQIDPSLIYDYNGLYTSLQTLRVVPVTMSNLAELAAVLLVPFIPILFIHFSVAELLQKIAGLLM